MSALEHARRHNRPRYQPLAPNRGGSTPDPARAEHTHPSWCDCLRCQPPSPADRAGCAFLAFGASFAIGASAVALGLGVTFIVDLIVGGPGLAILFGQSGSF